MSQKKKISFSSGCSMLLYQSRNVFCSDFLSFGETLSLFTLFFLGTVSFDAMSHAYATRLGQ